jgi:hypothetical protein
MVVIMIGRKRNRLAWWMASTAGLPSLRSASREIDHHDRVFLYDADQQDDSDQGDHAEIVPREE